MEHMNSENKTPAGPGWKLALPFWAVMILLTVVAFIIPLRPTVSYSEKRELTKFPEFTLEALVSGDYFDGITLWFSDTFPGRETWMQVSDFTKSLHGYSEVSIVESDFVDEILNPDGDVRLPEDTLPQDPATHPTDPGRNPEESSTDVTEPEGTEPEETGWGGVDAGEEAEISMGAVIQIGDSAFNQLGFSSYCSDRYSRALSALGDALAERGIRLISAPAPTAVGILVEETYLAKLNCASQREIIAYLHSGMGENVLTVDTYSALVAHNDEYIFFRTDHHWTALGAYYAYEAICQAADMEPAPLDSFREWDQGRFLGSLYGKVRYSSKLRADNVMAYVPQGEITTKILYSGGSASEVDLIRDKTQADQGSKYLCFLGTDYALMEITNDSIPDGGTCLVVKDSFGNCFVPFLTQNYHKVYVMDYRKYNDLSVLSFAEKYGVDDVIFIPYLIATQDQDGAKMFEYRCRIR